MDNAAESPQPALPTADPGSLQEIVARSVRIFFGRPASILGPTLVFFILLALVDIVLTAAVGPLGGSVQTAAYWFKQTVFVGGFTACTALAIGSSALATLDELDTGSSGPVSVFRKTMQFGKPLIWGTVLFNVLILLLAVPGGWCLYLAFTSMLKMEVGRALVTMIVACALLYYPARLIIQWILFGFVIVGEGAGGWQSLWRSRKLMLSKGTGGPGSSPMFRVFVLLKVSLIPALVTYVVLLMMPLFVAVIVKGPEILEVELEGRRLTQLYALFQLLHSVAWALIVPIFVVPLGVLYRQVCRPGEPAC